MRHHRREAVKRVLIIAAGCLLILIGFVCLLLPVIPQVPFFIAGLSLLATQIKAAKDLKDKLEERFPKVTEATRHFGYWLSMRVPRRVPPGASRSRIPAGQAK